MTYDQFDQRARQLVNELRGEYDTRLEGTREDAAKKMELAGEYVIKDVTERERLSQEYLTQQHRPNSTGAFCHSHLTGRACPASS